MPLHRCPIMYFYVCRTLCTSALKCLNTNMSQGTAIKVNVLSFLSCYKCSRLKNYKRVESIRSFRKKSYHREWLKLTYFNICCLSWALEAGRCKSCHCFDMAQVQLQQQQHQQQQPGVQGSLPCVSSL